MLLTPQSFSRTAQQFWPLDGIQWPEQPEPAAAFQAAAWGAWKGAAVQACPLPVSVALKPRDWAEGLAALAALFTRGALGSKMTTADNCNNGDG